MSEERARVACSSCGVRAAEWRRQRVVVCSQCRDRALLPTPAAARKKSPPINQAFQWNKEVRDALRAELRRRSEQRAAALSGSGLVPWLEEALVRRFRSVESFPGELLEVRETPSLPGGAAQRGIFARQPIQRATRVAAYRGSQVSFDSSEAGDRSFAVAVAPQVTMTVTSDEWPGLFNHCWLWPLPNEEGRRTGAAPFAWRRHFANLVVDDELQLWALRDIDAGEELCFDYGLAYWVESPFKPLWALQSAPAGLLEALRTEPQLRLLALASAVRIAPGQFLETSGARSR